MLTDQQYALIWEFLADSKLTYHPLKEELFDHICCDIDQKMQSGKSFEAAFEEIGGQLPPAQVQTLQYETMKTTNHKQHLSSWLAYLAFALLLTGTLFKLMRFPGAGNLLIGALLAMGISLLSGSILGAFANRDKQGVGLLLGIVAGICIFLTSFIFQVLNMPGATELRVISVLALCVLYPVSFFYVARHPHNLLAWLHDRNSTRIDTLLLLLFTAVVVIRIPPLWLRYEDFVSTVLLVLSIAGAGLHFYARCWKHLKNTGYKLLATTAFLCFFLPALVGVLNEPVRIGLAMAMYLMGVYLVTGGDSTNRKPFKLVCLLFVALIVVFWGIAQLGWLPYDFQSYLFNVPVFLAHLAIMGAFWKDKMLRTYMIMSTSHYLFIFPWQIGS